MSVYVATTRRSTAAEPLLHGIHHSLPRYSRTGDTFVAVCGAQVRHVRHDVTFDPTADRACRNCRKALA